MAKVINTLATVQRNGVKSEGYWQKAILEMIKMSKDNYIFQGLGKSDTLPKNEGTQNKIYRRANHLPCGPTGKPVALTEGTPPTALKVEYQKVTAAINQYGNYIEVTDVANDVAFDKIKKDYMPELTRIAMEERELTVLSSFSEASVQYVNGKTSYATLAATDVLTLKECRLAALRMKNYNRQGHPKYGGKFLVVVHTNVMQDLVDDSDLLNNILVPGNENKPTKDGTLTNYKAYGMYFTESLITDRHTVTASEVTTTYYHSYVLGKDAYVTIKMGDLEYKQTGFEASKSDPLGQLSTFGYKQWIGAKVIDPMSIVRVISRSNYDITADFSTDAIGKAATQ